ncbi:hypothetical protein [Candidatus Nitrosopumilus koreensis]|uniref:hypothetical protein n=1 Tax=Candidatus Nitrosopumilus koreensis TaxID=1510466 RepID=UPI000ACE46CB|nr:hypothetical protein [Candidatus Nitrosopumilus koreensis]
MSDISFLAEKVFVHRWPHDTPLWNDETKKKLDDTINKNPEPKKLPLMKNLYKLKILHFPIS